MGRIRSALGLLLPGARERRQQTEEYAAAWDAHNALATEADGPLWVAMGDSTAQGIGASAHDRGYVGVLLGLLRQQRDPSYRVVNLSLTGALTDDVLERQLPTMRALDQRVALVTCGIGGNDLLRTRTSRALGQFEKLIASLPAGTVIANCPQGLSRGRTAKVNALIAELAPTRELVIADVHTHTGAPWTGKYAADKFHPNDLGYREWVEAFAAAMNLKL